MEAMRYALVKELAFRAPMKQVPKPATLTFQNREELRSALVKVLAHRGLIASGKSQPVESVAKPVSAELETVRGALVKVLAARGLIAFDVSTSPLKLTKIPSCDSYPLG